MTSDAASESGPPRTRGGLPAFRRHLRVEAVPDRGTFLLSDRGLRVLAGRHVGRLATLLDGTRDVASVLREAGAGSDAGAIGADLSALIAAGLVARRDVGPRDAADPAAAAYWDAAGVPGPAEAARIGLTVTGRTDPAAVRRELAALDVPLLPDDGDPADAVLDLVVCDDYLAGPLREIDVARRAAGRPWLLARPGGSVLWTGPVFRPGQGPCWACLAYWLAEHRAGERVLQEALGLAELPAAPAASLAATRSLGLRMAALEALKWIAGHRYEGQETVQTLDTLTLEGRRHTVSRRPQCPACGDPALGSRADAPVVLAPRAKGFRGATGHRAASPQEVLDRYGHLVSDITGPVAELRRTPHGPAGLNAFVAGHNLALTAGTSGPATGLRQFAGGKGTTETEARAGALCEALERRSGVFDGTEPRVRETLRALGADAVPPNAVQLYAERQFRERAAWNPGRPGFEHVCDPLPDGEPIDWSPVWSLTGRRRLLLPTALLYYGVPPSVAGRRYARADSNGCAAGSSLEDAVLQGFLELVERDAVALWWYNRTCQPALDLDAFADPWLAGVQDLHAGLHRKVWALDLTADLGIPVVAALSRRTDRPPGAGEDIVFGFGAHLDLAVAVKRAVAEMNQLTPAVVDARADGTGYGLDDPAALAWWRGATTAGHPYLVADPERKPTGPADRAFPVHSDLRDDLAHIEGLLAGAGLDLLVLDQTRPDIALPVARVLVPGLRPFWRRLAPGRLYDVPVRLGRLPVTTRYEDVNPLSMFI